MHMGGNMFQIVSHVSGSKSCIPLVDLVIVTACQLRLDDFII